MHWRSKVQKSDLKKNLWVIECYWYYRGSRIFLIWIYRLNFIQTWKPGPNEILYLYILKQTIYSPGSEEYLGTGLRMMFLENFASFSSNLSLWTWKHSKLHNIATLDFESFCWPCSHKDLNSVSFHTNIKCRAILMNVQQIFGIYFLLL